MLRLLLFFSVRPLSLVRPARKKKASKTRTKSTTVSFPVDFFEHCQALNEVEFGGGDILQVYNVQQTKHRLLTAGMYIASTKVCSWTLSMHFNFESRCLGVIITQFARQIFTCLCLKKSFLIKISMFFWKPVWKLLDVSGAISMYACFHDCVPFVPFWAMTVSLHFFLFFSQLAAKWIQYWDH